MSKAIRISKQLGKRYPQPVVNQIKSIAERYHIKSFKAETVTPDKKFYMAKDEKSYKTFGLIAAHNIGASALYRIGEQFSMPAGTYLINVYCYDKYYMTVYQIEHALPDMANSLYINAI